MKIQVRNEIMPYKKYSLPEYPVKLDMWDIISRDKRRIAVYGMGNGADKLFDRLSKYGRAPDAVFASDGFVRGHSFRGYEVTTLARVEEQFGEDFIILVSFASSRPEVIDLIKGISEKHTVFIPDMPVAGEEYFDKDFFNSRYEEICKAYGSLADEDSKNLFAAMIRYKLFGSPEYIFNSFSSISDIYTLLPSDISAAVDAGAYNGDTAKELISFRPEVERIYAIEPDRRNFRKLNKVISEQGLADRVIPYNFAVWSKDEEGSFIGSGNRNSSVSSTASHENKKENVLLARIDTLVKDKIDYVKYDVEGAELEALLGSSELIERDRPALLVSAYHRSEDVFSLVNYLSEKYPFYRLFMRKTLCFPAWEIAIIAKAIENHLEIC